MLARRKLFQTLEFKKAQPHLSALDTSWKEKVANLLTLSEE
jgi:hypothetical protein